MIIINYLVPNFVNGLLAGTTLISVKSSAGFLIVVLLSFSTVGFRYRVSLDEASSLHRCFVENFIAREVWLYVI